MKFVISLFLIALSLLTEITAATGTYWCNEEREKMETESSEACEQEATSFKITTQVRKTQSAKSHFEYSSFTLPDVLQISNTTAARIHKQHLIFQRPSPIYLNNSIFLL